AIILFAFPAIAQVRKGIVKPSDYQYSQGEDSIRLLSWNVEHFVDKYDNPYIQSDRESLPDSNKVKERCRLLAEALRAIDADVVVLQEFESQPFLQQIEAEYLSDMGYRFFASSPAPTWYMNVVIMSRFPLGVVHGYGSVTTPVEGSLNKDSLPETQNHINTRMLSVEVFVNEKYSFILTGLHLKAGRGERNEAMRSGQINFLNAQFRRYRKERSRTNQVILGDLNCTPDSKEFALITDDGHRFYNIWADGTLTHPADQPARQLDYILPDRKMYKDYIPGSAQVIQLYDPEKMRRISDHLPVIAEFRGKD
ncbi:MAG: endonuclease/exonuclease/phosphatase family protein, partial [Bacteroidota bacterium]